MTDDAWKLVALGSKRGAEWIAIRSGAALGVYAAVTLVDEDGDALAFGSIAEGERRLASLVLPYSVAPLTVGNRHAGGRADCLIGQAQRIVAH